MVRRSKRYQEAAKKIDRAVAYELDDALKILTGLKGAKFDETVEIAVSLGIEPKRSDQQVRGAVSLPRGIGKNLRVISLRKANARERKRHEEAARLHKE